MENDKMRYLAMVRNAKQAVEILTKGLEECETLAKAGDPSDVAVTISLEEADFALISQAAQSHGVTVPELLRDAALEQIEYEAAAAYWRQRA